jgi:hypothetical protein
MSIQRDNGVDNIEGWGIKAWHLGKNNINIKKLKEILIMLPLLDNLLLLVQEALPVCLGLNLSLLLALLPYCPV